MPRVEPGQSEIGIYTYGRITHRPKPNVCYIVDVAGVRDPQANRGFRKTYPDGRAGAVQEYVAEDSRIAAIIDNVRLLAEVNLRADCADGKWLSIGIRDHHGKWAAPAIGEIVADSLSLAGFRVSVIHFDLELPK